MARQSLSPMKDLTEASFDHTEGSIRSVGRKRKDAPMTHLKYLRKCSGYTLEALSEITSISISYLSRLESGSRRLNTDLIRRLSHAFACDPAELLQEVSHDSQIVTPVEFSKKRRGEVSMRGHNLPLYRIVADKSNPAVLSIEACGPAEWRQRPAELSNRTDIFAIKAESFFAPHFTPSSTLYLEPSTNLVPESTIVLLNSGKITVKKIWSITPTTLQLCDIGDIDRLKSGTVPQGKLMEVERSSTVSIYKVVGYSDFGIS